MIKVNYMSQRIYDVMVKRFNIGENASIKLWVNKLSVLWREANKSINEKECSRFFYSKLELVLADIIMLCIAMLHRTGVNNIENLIRRRLDESDKNNKLKR
jgi:hypothetical protein